MTGTGDRPFDALGSGELDADLEMLLDGIVVHPRLVPLAQVVDDVRLVADGPAPAPTDELAGVLDGDDAVGDEHLSPGAATADRLARRAVPPVGLAAAGRRPVARIRVARRVAALGLAAKVAIVLAVASAGAVGARAGVLPDQTVDAVRRVIEVITPIDLPDDNEASGRGENQGGPDTTTSGLTDGDPLDLTVPRGERTQPEDSPVHVADPPPAQDAQDVTGAQVVPDEDADGETPAGAQVVGGEDADEDGDSGGSAPRGGKPAAPGKPAVGSPAPPPPPSGSDDEEEDEPLSAGPPTQAGNGADDDTNAAGGDSDGRPAPTQYEGDPARQPYPTDEDDASHGDDDHGGDPEATYAPVS